MRTIQIADLFCGAGGTSSGALRACESLKLRPKLTAINHWPVAVATHALNHPDTRHLCASLDSLNPTELFAEGELDLLLASPECTHHSIARGGKPVNDQSRATGHCVTRWAQALLPRRIIIENVKEFEHWGPLVKTAKGWQPDRKRRGETFQAWVGFLRSFGYQVDWRILNCADYGDPTTRKRLFVQCRLGGGAIRWPEPTHAKPDADGKVPEGLKPWRTAREIIDWTLPSESIFERKRPLAPKTMARIEAGLRKYGLRAFILPQHRGGRQVHGIDEPLSTICGKNGTGVCEPFIVKFRNFQDAEDIDAPLSTVTNMGAHHGLAEPFLVRYNGELRLQSVDNPIGTLDTQNRYGVAEPFLIKVNQTGDRSQSVDAPLKTITTKNGLALCEPYLIKYYGSGEGACCVDDPLATVTARERFGLAEPILVELDGETYRVDVRFRMLQPHELAAAQGFGQKYQFTGTKSDTVKQIGNAVPTHTAEALVRAAIGGRH